MDDYSVSSLAESQNEWCARLVHILTPLIIDGFKSIFDESWALCKENDELDKYLMTFQNFITRIPKWNHELIESEKNRIIEKSNCGYLEDLITCVHIIKLKSLTCVRVGQKQKKVNINIPSLSSFIHRVYINVARKIYTNVYLFEKNIAPLLVQKNNRELEVIVKECILFSIRENIPVESILRAYLDETQETDVEVEEHVEELLEEKEKEVEYNPPVPVERERERDESRQSVVFNELPETTTSNSVIAQVAVKKAAADEENDAIKIGGDDVILDDIFDLSPTKPTSPAPVVKLNEESIDLGIELLH